jgi:hypothetical protein
MAEAIFFRLQEQRRRALEEAVDAWKADHEGAAGALQVEAIVTEALQLREDVRRLWQTVLALARADCIDDYPATGGLLRQLCADNLRLMRNVGGLARSVAGSTGHEVRGLVELDAATAELSAWADRELAQWPWVDAPPLPIDPAMVEQSRASRARGEAEDVGDVLARVQAGGPLVKE